MNYQCKSPVLFHLWNRIDVVKKTFKEIKKAKPKKFYISSDGPNNGKDKKKIIYLRNYVERNINWDCEIKKIYFKKNLGPKLALPTVINKIFLKENKLIIIDHDCLCDNSFFRFMDELLEIYKNENKVKAISGNYICKNLLSFNHSYYFAQHPIIFGWATWKRAWKEYDVTMKKFNNLNSFFWLLIFFKFNVVKTIYFYNKFKLTKSNKINTWDYQLLYSIWKNQGIIIRSTVNISKHIGWGPQAYHGKYKDDLADIKINKIKFPLRHPKSLEVNKKADEIEYLRVRKLYFWKSFRFFISRFFISFFRS